MAAATFASLDIQTPTESNLAVTVLDQQLRVILLTAPNRNSGVTTSSLALANELARTSRGRVLLLDTSLADDSLTQRLGLEQNPGFLDLVLAEQPPSLASCIEHPGAPGFDFLPLGRRQQYSERLTSQPLRELFAALNEVYRFVIVDGDPVYSNGDLLTLSTQVDGVVLVVRSEETRWEVAQAAAQRLVQAEAKLIGSVFNARKYYMPKWVYDRL
ncbi:MULTISPECIES: CpsD/CapB family tyrosine-protein kinase [Pseudomonas]|jgi:Mrp family chromosome partitioning ATPase|uniref:CpsD/CapB family tyrosine-protein kinase n=2 Tax=Pseudomonas chlororaphis TaxID=587753 RepID=A0AAP9W036_9PSED|nr:MULTISPECIES: CpsD/CapB family tyrosine-protein kinase [Pseudomonas]AIC20022.1 cobalamin biosynthesis protein CobQ [Pseudomonas chlororaphis]AUG41058.1 cobalamin biosynthesis protein CobQ [Pseudomonas chlororaphis]AZD48401.1 Tyrosine-protein kinase EpsD [Pseudomonas chlororaphis subsp. aurantiaca]AZD54802.1 Tyrosine-protein kinase EpsD [Pseudomonas chlororaphis subsp. aurantiaca]AZD73343.1 Tyrosine-protein kinase EpsD [Pseudomonas chlororaphis subsp. aurantiaca]